MTSSLLLWDVDFTLVNTDGIGRRLYELAFAELYGRPLSRRADEARMAGRTDRAIALEVLTLSGVADPPGEVAAFEAMLARLAPGLAGQVARTGLALPGATEALAAFAAAGWARQSVLTGNIRQLAEIKLGPLGLTTHLDLEVGAYGNENAVRTELVPLARARAARAYGEPFDGHATVLIGDTPLDVEAALLAGARAVAVATGRFSAAELAAAGAHVVLPDLTNTAAVLAAALAS